MRVVVASVGRPRQPGLTAAIQEYETRAARYWPLDVREVREESARAAEPELVRTREGERLLATVPPAARLLVCDERGAGMTSEQFAEFLIGERDVARDVTFIIGGAYGVSEAVRARGFRLLALAPWTVPHEMARLLLAEQLYRAGTILRGEPYHK